AASRAGGVDFRDERPAVRLFRRGCAVAILPCYCAGCAAALPHLDDLLHSRHALKAHCRHDADSRGGDRSLDAAARLESSPTKHLAMAWAGDPLRDLDPNIPIRRRRDAHAALDPAAHRHRRAGFLFVEARLAAGTGDGLREVSGARDARTLDLLDLAAPRY